MIYLKLFENFKKKYFILLVGPPGSGKSYYIKSINKNNEYDVINRDDIAIEVAEENGFTYKELFTRPPKEGKYYNEGDKTFVEGYEKYGEVIDVPVPAIMATEPNEKWRVFKLINQMNDEVQKRFEQKFKTNKSIIIDMTNVTKQSRNFVISKLENRNDYIIKAVVFNRGGVGMEDMIVGINKKRDLELKKIGREKLIPEEGLRSFIARYEEPSTETEDIDEVEFIDNKKELNNYVNERIISNFALYF